ncbi:MAG: hypothetical protein KQ78_01895 [Candidatus Izimaplasma bacterium HR2]|nr:MAG: hypothetical protein KQ78_01895 [Candidatus Izimaplasma bacterium HR2]
MRIYYNNLKFTKNTELLIVNDDKRFTIFVENTIEAVMKYMNDILKDSTEDIVLYISNVKMINPRTMNTLYSNSRITIQIF